MIAYLKGILISKYQNSIVLDVGGVGYELFVSQQTFNSLPAIGQSMSLFVHTQMSDSSLNLFGFVHVQEKQLFKLLMTISGIGPKLSIQILSGLKSHELIRAILEQDLLRLTSISGIGKKTAERILIELKDKILKIADPSSTDQDPSQTQEPKEGPYYEVLSALINLGYNRQEAEKTLRGITSHPAISVEELLKKSLSMLAN